VVAGIGRDGRPASEPQLVSWDGRCFYVSTTRAGVAVPGDDEHLRALTAEGRVLLAMTPGRPLSTWTCWGLD